MKNFLRVLMLVLVFVLAFSVLVACNEDPDDGSTDGTTDGTGEDDGDTTKKLSITFTYIDKNGNELKDVDGYSSYTMKNIKYGDDARAYRVDDVKSFEKYVITGWNADKEAAKAGTADANAVKNIKKDTVLYSVVRDKEVKTVTFLKPDGTTVIGTLPYYEGSALGKEAPRPTVPGQYFKQWKFVANSEEGKQDSTTSCIYGACSFQAVMGATDGTIGLVAKDSVTLDGKKDAAYGVKNPEAGEIGAAYLALNNAKTSNDSYTVGETYTSGAETKTGTYALPSEVKADTWMLWDGASIYLLIEVYDTSLTCRNDAYVKKGIDSYFNDAVELWYSFEQDATLTENKTRVGLAAAGDNVEGVKAGEAKYALPRSVYKGALTGIGGGRSTHFDEIKYAVRNYIYDASAGKDLTGLDAAGVEAPSYTIELKIPAKTEGKADETKAVDATGAKLKGTALENFKATGRLDGRSEESNAISDYAFTPGDDLMVGDYVRFCLQINDLKISQDDLNSGDYFDSPKDLTELKETPEGTDLTQEEYEKSNIALFELDESTGKWIVARTSGKFTAAGSTQHNLSMYLMFSLGGDANGSYKVEKFQKNPDDRKAQIMIGTDGQEYNRPLEVEE
ncbi:MAG: hypothetical protein E7657_01830 [Ruminococcaceae bacterium]|nr:hypothetical protein [Oscillospiraceae bacterium]